MSKAEELASKEWSDLGFCNNEQSNAFKLGYLKGYRQAEKGNELTWEDIRDILKIYDAFTWKKEWVKQKTLADGYQEILKRFKETRNERHV